MPSDPSKAGRIGGSRNTPAQQAARRRNGFQPRKVDAMIADNGDGTATLYVASADLLPPQPACERCNPARPVIVAAQLKEQN
jgi:hypothetical protein